MSFRNWLITGICALSFCATVRAEGTCHSIQLAGQYGMSMTGWVTVAPGPVVVPFAVLGTATIDQTGSGSGPATQVIAGQTFPTENVTFRLNLAPDCTLTFVADCRGGCHWEGTGIFYKAGKQIDLLFTKVGQGQTPVTVLATMKQL